MRDPSVMVALAERIQEKSIRIDKIDDTLVGMKNGLLRAELNIVDIGTPRHVRFSVDAANGSAETLLKQERKALDYQRDQLLRQLRERVDDEIVEEKVS